MDESNPLLDHILSCIFGLLKKHFSLLISDNPQYKGLYDIIKKLIIQKCLKKFLSLNNPSRNLTNNMSGCFTLLIIGGSIFHWTNCIPELIEECYKNSNSSFCYIILRALGYIDSFIHYNRDKKSSYDDILILTFRERNKIKDKLTDNNKYVFKFIFDKFCEIENNNTINANIKNEIIEVILDIIRCWTIYGLNILKNENIANIVYYIMENYEIKNPEAFSDLVNESISNSDNAQKYEEIDIDGEMTPEELSSELFKIINLEEKKGLDTLINFVFKKIEYFQSIEIKNQIIPEAQKKLYHSYIIILESIINNYIYFFFNFSKEDKERSQTLLSYYNYYLKHKNRQISSIFMESMGTVCHFICNFYRFSGLNNEQKAEFKNYFNDILKGVMENCAYNNINYNNISLLDTEIITQEENKNLNIKKYNEFIGENDDNKNNNQNDDDDPLEEIITLDFYRNASTGVFDNIICIIRENYGDKETSTFIEDIVSPIISVDEKNILNDVNYGLKLDVIFLVLSSFSDNFRIIDNNIKDSMNIIINIINYFLDSKIVISNQLILVDFIILIYKYSKMIGYEVNIFYKTIKFLMLISKNIKNDIIENCCYMVIANICSEKNDNINLDINIIEEFFNLFKEKYPLNQDKKLIQLKTILKIILSLLGIKKESSKEKISPDKIKQYKDLLNKICEPIYLQLEEFLDNYEKNIKNISDINIKSKLIFEIKKCYKIQKKIIERLELFDLELKKDFIKDYIDKYVVLTEKCLNLFYNEGKLMKKVYIFYEKNARIISEKCQNNFDKINKIFITFFLSNKSENNFNIISILKELYSSLLSSAKKDLQNYNLYNTYILEQYFIIMQNGIKMIKNSDNKNPKIKDKLYLICDFHNKVFPNLIIINQNEALQLLNDIILFFIESINLLISLESIEITRELTIASLIESFNVLYQNKYFYEIYRNSPIINNIMQSLWNIIKLKGFNDLSRKTLVNFYNIVRKIDLDNFFEIFKNLIGENFEEKNIKSMMNYFQIFINEDKTSKDMIVIVIEIIQGKGDWKQFENLLILAERQKFLNKIKK